MSMTEIAFRLRQAFAKRLDSRSLFLPSFETLPKENLLQIGKFFFEPEEVLQRLKLICENIPNFEVNIITQAEQIMRNNFSLLGYGVLDYGREIDWQLDIVSGKRAPFKPWPQIDYLDFQKVGDCKVTWELSRHQFLPTLAKAWLLTGDERFIKKLEYLYYDWQQQNPYPHGINWASSLEVAFRSLAWIWTLQLLAGCESTAKLRLDMIRALAFNAWYIKRYLSIYFSPNTHLQGEAVALYFIGTLFPLLPAAQDWRETGWNILLEHARTKVMDDGAYFEQSIYYHVYALDFFMHARILAERNDKKCPSSFDKILKKMLKYLALLSQAGPPPRFGDDDGGRVFDCNRILSSHMTDPLAIGASLYSLQGLKQPSVNVTEEMLWLLGVNGLNSFLALPTEESVHSAKLIESGLYICQLGGDSRSQLCFDAGSMGWGSGGHSHADALSITLSLDGKAFLVDPGAFLYCGSNSERDDFRVTQMHNTITVDNASQAQPQTAFSWFRRPVVTLEVSVFTQDFEFIVASHDGYKRLNSPVTHRRSLFSPHQGFWFVFDELISGGTHDCTLNWHLAPNTKVQKMHDNIWCVESNGSKLHILTAAYEWRSSVSSDWFSPAYGIKQAAPVIRYTKDRAVGGNAIATIFSESKSDSEIPILTALKNTSSYEAYRLVRSAENSMFIFGDGLTNINIDGWDTDAKFLYLVMNADGYPLRAILIQVAFARYRGMIIHESTEKLASFIWTQ